MAAPWEKFKTEGKPWEKFSQPTEKPLPAPAAPEDYAGDANAALQGFGQGASFGYLPQLQAAAEPAMTKIMDLATGGDQYADLPSYVDRRDKNIDLLEKLQKSNPKSFVGGALAGGLTTGLAIPQASLGANTALGTRMAAQVGMGMGQRMFVQNPGDVKGVVDPVQSQARAQTLADPLAIGIDAAIPMAGPVLSQVGGYVGKKAEKLAFKSLGPYARDSIKAFAKDKVNDIGRTLLDTGAVGGAPKSYQGLLDKISSLKNNAGTTLGETVEMMAQKEGGNPIGVSRMKIGDQLGNDLISKETDAAGIIDRNAKLQAHIDAFKAGGEENIPLLQAEMKKRGIAKEINYDRLPGADIPIDEQFNRALVGKLRSGVEQGGEALAEKTGFDVNKFKDMKNTYGNLATAEDIAAKRTSKDFANRFLSPSDYGAGLVGAGFGAMSGGSPEERAKHALMGAGLGLINHGARKYGNQVMAVGANRLGQGIDALATGANAAALNPVATQMMINQPNIWQTLYGNKGQ
jgi:hypothetical protein